MTENNKYTIGIMGAGYVGFTQAVIMAQFLAKSEYRDLNYTKVTVFDINESKINLINQAQCPLYEPGLSNMLLGLVDRKDIFEATTDISKIVDCDIIYLCVGTPSNVNGSVNLEWLYGSVTQLLESATQEQLSQEKLVVIKSTVPPGTNAEVTKIVKPVTNNKWAVISNPEFLREGFAVQDFINPDKVVIGHNMYSVKDPGYMLLDRWIKDHHRLFETNIPEGLWPVEAEIIKYANNSILAMKVTFANEVARIADHFNLSPNRILDNLRIDRRIGSEFLNPGPGYGGACFPKDVAGLNYFSRANNLGNFLLDATIISNKQQMTYVAKKIYDQLLELTKKVRNTPCKVMFLGATFKPNTDDIRGSQTIEVITELDQMIKGDFPVIVNIHDPQAPQFDIANRYLYKVNRIHNNDYVYIGEHILDSDIVVLMTDWDIYIPVFDSIRTKATDQILIDPRYVFQGPMAKALASVL